MIKKYISKLVQTELKNISGDIDGIAGRVAESEELVSGFGVELEKSIETLSVMLADNIWNLADAFKNISSPSLYINITTNIFQLSLHQF